MAHEALIALMREQAVQLAEEGVNGTPNLLREAADALEAKEARETALREALQDAAILIRDYCPRPALYSDRERVHRVHAALAQPNEEARDGA